MKSKFYKIAEYLFKAFLFLYPLFFIFQGLDFTDEGFGIATANQFFEDPTQITRLTAGYYFTMFVNGLWLKIFPGLGLVGLRFVSVLLFVSTFYLTYKLLRERFKKLPILAALSYVAILLLHNIEHFPTYNLYTTNVYLLVVYIFSKYKTEISRKPLALIGLISLFSVGFRLPNVMISVLVLVGLILASKTVKIFLRNVCSVLLGAFIGVVATFIILFFAGHLTLYCQSIYEIIFNVGIKSNELHSFSTLFANLFRGYEISIIYVAPPVVLAFLLYLFVKKIGKKLFKYSFYHDILLGLITIALIFYYNSNHILYSSFALNYLGVQCFWLLVIIFDSIKKDLYLRNLAFYSLLIIILQPMGSGAGSAGTIYTFWLSTAFCFSYFVNFFNSYSKYYLYLIFIPLISYYSYTNISTSLTQYGGRDDKARSQLIHSVSHPKVKYIYTTIERKMVLEDLLCNIDNYIPENRRVLFLGSTPMLYYMTDTYPIVGRTWNATFFKSEFEAKIALLEQNKNYPLILRTKGSCRNNWPKVIEEDNDNKEDWEIVSPFIEKYNYRLVWSNNFFEIYLK